MVLKNIRKAILIGAPGGQNSTYLPGVKKDLHDFKTFLCSFRGGLWREDEIQTLYNPSAEDAVLRIQSTHAEYLLVYFSGHGYTDLATRSRLLCFKHDAVVSDKALTQTTSPRLQLFSDACRNYYGEGIGGIPLFDPDYFDFTAKASEIRHLFDQAILASPPGKAIIHGTAENQYAMDSKNGGYFTQALLHVAERMRITTGLELVTTEQLLYHVPSVLQQKGNEQKPEIIYLSGKLKVPFAVAMPLPGDPPQKLSTCTLQATNASSNGNELLVGLGLLAFALYLSD